MKTLHINTRYWAILFPLLFISFFPVGLAYGQSMLPFTLKQVKILPGPFYTAQQTDLKYILSLDPDRLLAPYQKEAGLTPTKENYPNWENTGLDGHIGGHYLSALSNMYASTGDTNINKRLSYMLTVLKTCQDKIGTGYLGGTPGGIKMWQEIAAGQIVSDTFSLNGKWVPLYNIHKLMAGLRDAYIIAGKPRAKQMLIRLADFIDSVSARLDDNQIQQMLFSEHGSIQEVLADVADISGNKKYLQLARRYSHQFILQPLIRGEDKLTGLHANTQIAKVVGFDRIAQLTNDTSWGNASRFFWQTVQANRSVVIGGNSVDEHFNGVADYKTMLSSVAGPETCNTYNMLKLSKSLFLQDGSQKYIEYYERALYNHILSSQHPVRGGFVYYTPMRSRHYRVYSQPQDCMWCCVGSGMENHGKYGELIYSYTKDDLFVNLFMASKLYWPGKELLLSQDTYFPEGESTTLSIQNVKPSTFTIQIRYPGWVAAGKLSIKINGHTQAISALPGSYIKLTRKWQKDDVIEVHLPMKLSTEKLYPNANYFAFLQGPIVLAAKTDNLAPSYCNGNGADQFGGYRASGKQYNANEIPWLITKDADFTKILKPEAGKPLTYSLMNLITSASFSQLQLIPFYKIHDGRYIIYWQKKER